MGQPSVWELIENFAIDLESHTLGQPLFELMVSEKIYFKLITELEVKSYKLTSPSYDITDGGVLMTSSGAISIKMRK